MAQNQDGTDRMKTSNGCFSLAEASRPLPGFADLDLRGQTLPDGVGGEHLEAFQTLYREHCEVGGSNPTRH